jgi:hypothetical protein
MKKLFIPAVLLLSVSTMFTSSCKKDDKKDPIGYKCATCVTTAEAVAANDALAGGIYKGVVIGSSGTIKFSVMNGTNDITATMVLDGVTVMLTSAITWVSGQSYVAPFTGTMNGQSVSITFSVQNDGSAPLVTSSTIPGHPNAVFSLLKETSGALLEAFEGTYSTTLPETGTFNILLSRPLGKWGGTARKTGATTTSPASGTIANGELKDGNGTKIGTLSNDDLSGSFQDNNAKTVTLVGKRTL